MLTPNEAARRLKVSRRTVMRLVKDKQLKAEKRNSGWLIDPVSVEEWARSAHAAHEQMPIVPTLPTGNAQGEIIAAQAAEIAGLRERLAEIIADRDAWRTQAQTLAARPAEGGQGGLFRRWLRR